jgi:4-aminobutyrate aminotransferase
MAKGLGNGLAIGAVMGRAEVVDSISGSLHVSTFGGNHLSTAGARANLEYILANDLQGNANEVGGYLRGRLEKMSGKSPVVREVRGRGLMLGLEMVDADLQPDPEAAARFMEACRERGVLVGKGGMKGNVIRIAPPMTVTREAAATAAQVFEEALSGIRTPERG